MIEQKEKPRCILLTEPKAPAHCNGNLQGISKLVEGMDIDTVIERLDGIHCGMKETSCPDQLANALKKAREKLAEEA